MPESEVRCPLKYHHSARKSWGSSSAGRLSGGNVAVTSGAGVGVEVGDGVGDGVGVGEGAHAIAASQNTVARTRSARCVTENLVNGGTWPDYGKGAGVRVEIR